MRNRNPERVIEQRIASHVQRGEPVRLASVAATTIMRVLLGRATLQRGRAPLFHLCDARISGALELRNADVEVPLVFENCTFDEPVAIGDSDVKLLEFRACAMPAFDGRSLRIARDLALTDTRIGWIDLFGARIDGHLWLTGSCVQGARQEAPAIDAPGIRVAGGVYANRLEALGTVNLWGAEIGAALELCNATLSSGRFPALRASNLLARLDVRIASSRIDGGIDLFGARVGGDLWLTGTKVGDQEGDYAISAPSIEVAGGFYARGLTVRGGLNLWSADIGAGLELDRANLAASGRPALRAPKMVVSGDITVGYGAMISGAVDLDSATAGGSVKLAYRVDDEHMLSLSDSHLKMLCLEVLPGDLVQVNLAGSVVTALVDNQKYWPRVLNLDRMTYQTLRPLLSAKERVAWLKRDEGSDSPQPYEQLARQYREAGHDHGARTVLLAKCRDRTRRQRFLPKLWGFLQDVTVGYGYRPVRALAWLAGLTIVVAVCSAVWRPYPVAGSAPPFNSAVYALDVVLPILDLGQEKSYTAVGVGRIVVWIAVLAGWVLASTVIAAVTRTTSRN
ncbi:hypothetical protein [Amycolatopsis sp. NPDC004079]|uniref:hypothetical protein n=1 Tax=Amycolatopsis sp. NPDC004079 TaxID=3154549 RepID=UPI0033B02303